MSDAHGGNPFAAPDDQPTPPAPASGEAPQAAGQLQGWDAAPGQPYWSAPAQPSGASPVQPYGSAPTQAYDGSQPYGSGPAQAYGSGPAQAYGSGPAQAYGSGPAQAYGGSQPYGAGPAQPYGAAPSYPPGAPPGSQAYPTYPAYPAYPGAYPTVYPGYAPPPQGTDGVAIAALATTLGGLVLTAGLASFVGLPLGIWGLVRTRRSGRPGKGMSIASIIVSGLAVLGWVALVVIGIAAAADGGFDDAAASASDGSGASDGYTLRNDLIAGTCLDVYPATFQMDDAHVVDCAQRHGAEVVMRRTLPGPVQLDASGQPTGTVYDDAVKSCELEITALSPDASDAGVADVFFTDPQRWPADNGAYCVFASQDADLQGSLIQHDLVVGGGLSS